LYIVKDEKESVSRRKRLWEEKSKGEEKNVKN
jgi:hypothetical protein